MLFKELPLAGAYAIELQSSSDDRGFFARMFCEKEFSSKGLNSKWVQINNSYSAKSATLRGLHFQAEPHSEVKVVRCVSGAIWDVMVDLRSSSSTFGCWYGLELSEVNRIMAYIPVGFAHGFISLSDDAELIYLVSSAYNRDYEFGLRWDDEQIGIHWPLVPCCISEKDKKNYSLEDLLRRKIVK